MLLPARRARAPDTWLIAEGFSCRMMVEQNVEGAEPLGLAEVVWRGMAGGR